MADNKNKTIFQRLTDVVIGTGSGAASNKSNIATYNVNTSSDVLYSFNSKEERDQKLLQLKQQKLLSYQWKKVGYDSSMESLAGGTQVRVMYRDADLMNQWPEINAALHIYAEEATVLKNGKIINIYSKSDRVKAVLEDLFVNRLNINIDARRIIYQLCKYGNDFELLNIDQSNGIIGWRELDVHQMRRIENNNQNGYGSPAPGSNMYNLKPDEVKFVWEGHNENLPFKNWQVCHFRLIDDTIFLPYGVSILNSARRHWRLLSMMEDALFLHRIERSVERRIFKVNVGAIDDTEVPAYLQQFANEFKRAPIVDPKTGQIDLRKNFLDVSADYFIPVRPGQETSTIETLQGAQINQGMEDIEYFEKKILALLRVPKTFLNFNEAQGRGQNLSLMDIRFNRTINWIQQTFLMEMTKIAIIHLYLLGFEDDLTNFTLTMNNPSNQIELMELDIFSKRLALANTALSEQGYGIPLMSWYDVQKTILGKTDNEISDMLNQFRLERALGQELTMTNQIIKKTGLFDKVDRLYGEPGAKYQDESSGEDQDNGGDGFSGGGFSGGGPVMDNGMFGDDFGNDMGDEMGDNLGDLGEPGSDDEGTVPGNEGSAPLNENIYELYKKTFLNEDKKINYRPSIINKGLMINEELMSKLNELEKINKTEK